MNKLPPKMAFQDIMRSVASQLGGPPPSLDKLIGTLQQDVQTNPHKYMPFFRKVNEMMASKVPIGKICNRIAIEYCDGDNLPKSEAKEFAWTFWSAIEEHPAGITNLAYFIGGENEQLGIQLLMHASTLGNDTAKENLKRMGYITE